MIRLMMTAAAVIILTGCAAATPLLVAEAGGHQLARHDEDFGRPGEIKQLHAIKDQDRDYFLSIRVIALGSSGRDHAKRREKEGKFAR